MNLSKVNALIARLANEVAARATGTHSVEEIISTWNEKCAWLGFKRDGVAWTREVLSHAIATYKATYRTNTVQVSEETLAWGGFLSGEIVPVAELVAERDAATLAIIAEYMDPADKFLRWNAVQA